MMRWLESLVRSHSGVRAVPAGLGRWGLYTYLEPHVRRLAAEHLSVASERLVCGASLRDDLAANPLNLRALSSALELEFAIVMPMRVVHDLRSYADLVHATGVLVRKRLAA
jgi:acyl carrier protein